LWRSRWAKKWCWQRDHDILFITFFLGQGNVATGASRPPLGRSPWVVVVIQNLKYGFDYYSLKVMSSRALLPFRGFSVTYILRTHKVCTSKANNFFNRMFWRYFLSQTHGLIVRFLSFQIEWDYYSCMGWCNTRGMHSSIQYLLAWEWVSDLENIWTFDLLTTTIILRCQDPLYWANCSLIFWDPWVMGQNSKPILWVFGNCRSNIYMQVYPLVLSLKNKGCVTLWPCHLHWKVS
jgi:hypothetical protein